MNLQLGPIVAALRRHKAGTVLIALQIALTLAIVSNALFIVNQRVQRIHRPTGLVEENLIAVQNRYVGSPSTFVPLMKSDVEALRAIPGVESAYATNAFPLRRGGWSTGIQTQPDATKDSLPSALYFVDEQALKTLGVKLIAGRNFASSEVVTVSPQTNPAPAQVIVTKAIADKLFPGTSALGKTVYYSKGKPSTIIGVIDKLTVPWIDFEKPDNVTLMPVRFDSGYTHFLVRTRPGEQESVFKAIPKTLFAANRMRVLPDQLGIRTFKTVRDMAYEADRGMAILMSVVCAVLLAVTAAGIVGLSSFWVGQRRKQIGVRRALGAQRRDILAYFMTENFLIALAGVAAGVVLALAMSHWMFTHFEMKRLSLAYVLAGVAILLGLGQLAVLAPALRASRVSPVEATRSV